MMPNHVLASTLGWLATAIFTGSYFFKRASLLRNVQMLGAAVWIVYGVAIGAPPVIAANLLVLGAAAWTSRRTRGAPLPQDR